MTFSPRGFGLPKGFSSTPSNGQNFIERVIDDSTFAPASIGLSTRYLNVTGGTGANASSPYSAANKISSGCDVRAWLSSPVWTVQYMHLLTDNGGASRGFIFRMDGGKIHLRFSTTGSDNLGHSSTANVPFSANEKGGVRATWAAGGVCTFYTRTDNKIDSDTGWTQLGTTVNSLVSGGQTVFDPSTGWHMGTWSNGSFGGASKQYNVLLYDAESGGDLVLDVNMTRDATAGTTTWTSATVGEEVWTVNGAATIVND